MPFASLLMVQLQVLLHKHSKTMGFPICCRERKRAQMHTLSLRSLELEHENAYLKEALGMRDTEVAGLRDKLASLEASASLPRGADGSIWTASKAEPAVLNGGSPCKGMALPILTDSMAHHAFAACKAECSCRTDAVCGALLMLLKILAVL